MEARQKNSLKGVALALLLAGGMGVTRVIEGVQKSLQKVSKTLAVNMADLRIMADATYEEAMDDASVADGKQKQK